MSTTFDLNSITNSLNEASKTKAAVAPAAGVSFAGKSLKLNTEDDAKEIAEAIEECEYMEYLDLEGNTVGPDAAKCISKAIEKNGSNLKRALWKDMFTGRMKDEIPVALEHFGQGLCAARTHLVELDLSDNAFGPIGVKGLAKLLSSSPCFTLKELRLNNNGLGITGGKMLADALLDCHTNSLKETSKPFALKVFVAGRNRLENEGAKALAKVFETLTSLEEVVMPQNGIYHVGISALATGLSKNPGLRILNLNDNIVGLKGSQALANVLHNFSNLERINLGDCLLKTRGALVLADALGIEENHPALIELNLSFNEIKGEAAGAIADAMADKTQLTTLILDGNTFGEEGRTILIGNLTSSNRIGALGPLTEDNTDDEEDEDEDEEEEEEEDDTENDETTYEADEQENNVSIEQMEQPPVKPGSVQSFLNLPTEENFLLLQGDKLQIFTEHTRNIYKLKTEDPTNDVIRVIMKVSGLCESNNKDVQVSAEQIADHLYSELFKYAAENDKACNLNNSLLVNLGLLKDEDKKGSKIEWNLKGCYKALEKACYKEYFPLRTKNVLHTFIAGPNRIRASNRFQEAENALKTVLDRMIST